MKRLMFILLTLCLMYGGVANAALPRFIDLYDGTVVDAVSKLRWLKNANCFGAQTWDVAMTSGANLKSGSCGLTDGSVFGDWHLPTVADLRIFSNEGYSPATLNTAGFTSVQGAYWSSESMMGTLAFYVSIQSGNSDYTNYGNYYVWPVRSGQFESFGPLFFRQTSQSAQKISVGDNALTEFIITNVGEAAASFSAQLSGTNALEFTVAPGGSSPCMPLPSTLDAGESCTLLVTATPVTKGAKTANVSISSASITTPTNILSIPLSVTATTTIRGTITDLSTGNKLAAANVILTGGATTQTDPTGNFTFDPQPTNGVYTVTINKTGYGTTTFNNVIVSDTAGANLTGGTAPSGLLNFGDQHVGTTSSGRQFSIVNTATNPKQMAVAFTGSNAPEFSLAPGGASPCSDLSPQLNAGESCTMQVKFSPTIKGTKNVNLTISSNGEMLNVPVTGNAITTIQGTVIDLSNGNRLPAATVTLTGGATTQTDPSGNFIFTPQPANGVYTVTITKTGYGISTINNVIVSDTAGANLAGGTAPSGLLNFGDQHVGTTSSGRQFSIVNTATNPKQMAVAFTGSNASEFNLASGGVSPCSGLSPLLNAGESCTMQVKFSPTIKGAKNANLTISSNGEILDVPVTGNAITTIQGTVIDLSTGNKLPAATVTLTGGATTQTDPSGNFIFNPQPANGVYTVTITKTGYGISTINNVIVSDTAGANLTVGMAPSGPLNFTVASGPLYHAETGVAYNQTPRISGGEGPYSFSQAYGTLPTGLTIDQVLGTISGIPSSTGNYTFAIGVTDSQGAYAEREFSIEVAAPLVLSSPTLPRGTQGAAYSSFISASGGTPPYYYEIASVGLPLGLTFDSSTGKIAGVISSAPATYTFSVNGSDSTGAGSINLVNNGGFENGQAGWDGSTIINGAGARGGTWYAKMGGYDYASNLISQNIQIPADGAAPTFSFWYNISTSEGTTTASYDHMYVEIMDNGLVSTLAIFSNANYTSGWTQRQSIDLSAFKGKNVILRFRATTDKSNPTTFLIDDISLSNIVSVKRSVTQNYTLNVDAALTNTTTRLNDGIVGSPFSQALTATGGLAPYSWSVYSGSLPAGLALNSATGIIGGTPTSATTQSVVIAVQDSYSRGTYKQFIVNALNPLQILTTSISNGSVNNSYSESIRTSGGIGPYSFSLTGQLPTGLTLNGTTGIVSGTPTSTGLTNLQVTVTDSSYPTPQTKIQNLNIRVTSSVTITTSAILPNAKKGVAINSVILSAKGGTPAYTWSIVNGYLPSGIILDPATGLISGTPTDRGDFAFTLRVTDSLGNATGPVNAPPNPDKQFILHVSDTLAITTGSVPNGAKGLAYNAILSACGGLKSYNWAVKAGTLPSGLTLSSDGVISGTPTVNIASSVTFEVTDSDAPPQKATITLIFDVTDTLSIFEKTIPDSRINQAYNANIRAQLGTLPYNWRISAGALPTGITMAQNAGIVVLAGTPTTAGTPSFTLEASDNSIPVQTVSRQFTIKVNSDPSVSSSGLKSAVRNTLYSDSVVASGGVLPYSFSPISGSLPKGLVLNSSNGTISGVTSDLSGQGSAFTIRVTDSGTPPAFVDKPFSIFVIDPLTISSTTVQGALQESAYGPVTLSATGGISPYTWSVSAGALPAGMTLAAATGTLSGTPSACGSFAFTANVADSSTVPTTSQKAFTLNVTCTSGVCGTSNEQTFTVKPTNNLCSFGTATSVTGTGPWNWTCTGSNGGTNANCNAAVPTFSLTAIFAGTGGGSVNGDISCTSGNACPSVAINQGANVNLIATPNGFSTFGGWSGACINSIGNCNLTMDSAKTVTATFTAAPKARVSTKAFSTLQTAYDDIATTNGSSIKLLEGTLANALIAGKDISVNLEGGYNATYSGVSTETTIQGPLRIKAGTIRMKGVNVK